MIKLFQEGLYSLIEYPGNSPLFIFGTVGFVLLALTIPYLIGSLNTAIIVSHLLYHDDIRKHGSGNAGMTNMLRTYGKGIAGLVLLGDVLKTVISIFIGGLLMGLWYVGPFALGYGGYLAAIGCIVGHVFPLYYRFKGGKGVLCAAAAVLMLNPIVFSVLILVFIIIVSFTKYISLGSVVSALLYPVFFNVIFKVTYQSMPAQFHMVLFTLFVAAAVTWFHRENLRRLVRGEESKLSFKHHEVESCTAETNSDKK